MAAERESMLIMKNVSKTFNPGTVNEKCALNGVNLTLGAGDFATIVGSNGAALRMLRFLMINSFPFCSYRTVCIPLNKALKGRFPQTKKAFLLAEWQHKKTHDP